MLTGDCRKDQALTHATWKPQSLVCLCCRSKLPLRASQSACCTGRTKLTDTYDMVLITLQGVLIAGSFSIARNFGSAGVGSSSTADAGCFASGLENDDEDTEFERRARGHLSVWCAPIDSDMVDSSNACGETLIFGEQQPHLHTTNALCPSARDARPTSSSAPADAGIDEVRKPAVWHAENYDVTRFWRGCSRASSSSICFLSSSPASLQASFPTCVARLGTYATH